MVLLYGIYNQLEAAASNMEMVQGVHDEATSAEAELAGIPADTSLAADQQQQHSSSSSSSSSSSRFQGKAAQGGECVMTLPQQLLQPLVLTLVQFCA
jgi:hypothetical protein